ncbi:MAG: PD-(D/E)XK nuclease family protein [Firmicutes bacterium]|nr:PD-(D/E)XK nuclease family protein [Bacillota bacterium]
MAKEILINQLFAGKYLDEGENIGHEIINFFKDDDGKNNLYITPLGTIKNHDLEYIIFVQAVFGRKTAEVIGVAKNIFSVEDTNSKNTKYAGVTLDKIFKYNSFRNEKDISEQSVTFRAKNFLLPKNRIFVTIDKNFNTEEGKVIYFDSERKVILNQSLRTYYFEKKDKVAYTQLKAFIENSDYWKEENTTETLSPEEHTYNLSPSFLEVIKKEDDENILSNLLEYYFEYSHKSFRKFAAEPNILNIPDMSSSFVSYREIKYRIDLWIESENDIIVIENKIKSGINGKSNDNYSYSQLKKYYVLTEKEAKEKHKKTHYYIFAPNYAQFDLSQFEAGDKYTLIKYSEIYKFFIGEAETYISDRFFPDFIRGLKRHTLTFPELRFEIMRSRLLKTVDRLQ